MRHVMLAAAVSLPWTVGEHRLAVLYRRSFVPLVKLHLVRARQVVQSLPIRRQRCREGVECNILAPVGPKRVARDLQQHLEAVHELDYAARLKALPGISVFGTAILVPGKSPARELAIDAHDGLVIMLDRAEEPRRPSLLIIHARLAKTLRQIHIVLVMDPGGPILHVLMDAPGQLQQPVLVRAVVKPIDRLDVVAEPDLGPVTRAEERRVG